MRGGDCAGEGRRDGAGEEDDGEGPAGPDFIAGCAGAETDEESSYKAENVGVGDVVLGEAEVFLDGVGEEGWEGVPGPEGDEETPPG